MGQIKPLASGERFGNLTVIGLDHIDKRRNSCWLCECDCGNRIVVTRHSLISGATKSCGCYKRGPNREDITGQSFGRLTVIGFDHVDRHRNSYWLCECECGRRTVVTRGALISGNTASCGCYNKERVHESTTTHGMSNSPLYKVWRDMKTRCENEHSTAYHRYGGRGIGICDDWLGFEGFRDWAIASGYNGELTLDRIDNELGYYPDNCRWADWETQGNNRSTNHIVEYGGESHTLTHWAKILDIPYSTLRGRVLRNDMRDFKRHFESIE